MGGILFQTPIPSDDPIAQPKRKEFGNREDPQEGHITRPWMDFFTSQGSAVQSSSRVVSTAEVTDAVAIGATDITNGDLPAGLYRFTYYVSILTPAGISSSVDVALDWTDNGNAKQETGAAITTNLATDWQRGGGLIYTDSASPVRYSTTYATVGIPDMVYQLWVVLEQVQA